MCGLVGFLTTNKDFIFNNNELKKMSRSLKHRGPDDENFIDIDKKLYLAHQRLSILDISKNGAQPMISSSGRFIIAFNGEIYNHLKIRKEILKYKSLIWRGTSDTETLIESFEILGLKKTLDKISGMFAFALIDKLNNKLYLARDAIGEKPIYYGYNHKYFFFTSELKSLQKHKNIDLKIDNSSISKYFKYGYIPAPKSIYKNVFKLPPASILEIDYSSNNLQNYNISKYWNINNIAKYNSTNNSNTIRDKCEDLLTQSIQEQMISDVPLGAFLSSGIDSSLIVSVMSKIAKHKTETFSIGFNEENYNEAKNAKKIASYLGTNHNEMYVNSNKVIDLMPKISKIYDEPFADSSQIPTYLVSKFARKKVTVSLSGDGGDELFCGYNRYVKSEKILRYNKVLSLPIKSILRYFLTRLNPYQWNKLFYFLNKIYLAPNVSLPGDKIYKIIDLIYKNDISELYDFYISFWKKNEKVFNNHSYNSILNNNYIFVSEDDFISEMMIIDAQTYLPDDILVKVDRASMANSLESRAPFLNKKLVEYAFSIPSKLKYNKNNKIILREILSKYIPTHLFDLPKSGFGIPLDLWIKKDLKDWVISLTSKNEIENYGILNCDYISTIIGEHLDNKRNWSNKIWSILMFQSWIQNIEK